LQKLDAAPAIADLRAVLRDQPDSVAALRQLASAHLLNGEPDLAVEALQKAAEAAPQDPAVHVALAELLAKQGQKAKAHEQLDVVLKNSPENLGALDILYKLQMSDADYAEAVQSAQRIKTQRPGLGEYYLGLVSQAQKKNGEAISHFEAALNKAPGAADALSALVKARLAQGQTAEAEQRLRKELARSSANFAAQNMLGEVLLLEKKTDAAIAALREAQRLDPSRATPYRNLAVAHMSKGERDAAVAVLQKGISATGHDPELVFALASYQGNQGKSDQAIALYEEALKARPREPLFMNNLAMMLASYRQDKADINRAVELGERLKDKNNPAYLDTLGWAYYRRGDMAAAVSVLEAASRQAPDSALLSYHLGMVYYQKGDHAAARRYLEKAVTAKQPYLGMDEAKATLARLPAS
jgi:tetratricopeptide (TPR) repeat protein